MHVDITAVTTQSNKIVLNKVKDNEALLEPSYGKKTNELFGQTNSIVGIRQGQKPVTHQVSTQ